VRVTRRRAIGVVVGVGGLALLWAPSFVARSFTDPAQPIDFLSRPDKGWRFLYDGVRLSRDAKLGSEGPALATAKRIWRRAEAVELVYLEHPLTIPAPEGIARSPRAGIVRPRSPLTWFVHGRIGDGPRRLIGLIDYGSGRVIWDLRRVARGSR
jgi:hypothetical protein